MARYLWVWTMTTTLHDILRHEHLSCLSKEMRMPGTQGERASDKQRHILEGWASLMSLGRDISFVHALLLCINLTRHRF